MAKLRVAVALMVSAAALMHWATGEPASALVPALVVVMYTFATHFHPKVVRKRIGIVSGARFISVFAAVAAWDTAVAWLVGLIAVQVLHSFGVAVDESTAAHAAFYAVYSIPLSLALKTQRPEMNAVTRLLVAVLYDPPIHMLVYAYAALGWRLNSLATPVAAGEVLLGALPYASDAASLRARGVTGVVNMCAEWPGPTKQYDALGIEQLHLPTTDGDMPSADAAIAAVRFIEGHVAKGDRVFVHCRCGIGRSATVVLCYLIATYGMQLDDAVEHLRLVRPEVGSGIAKYPTVRRFAALTALPRGAGGGWAAAKEEPRVANPGQVVLGEDVLAEDTPVAEAPLKEDAGPQSGAESDEEEPDSRSKRSSSSARRRRQPSAL
ncbi:hypothetical protein FNF28_01102 [Cafeteria roenbergensis]|uniref:Tyrosine specific protein phosphatases domain-containing protein n=1 Tax=Cafeteria roenbergensis TaxID=33653 RepID=A0A5A8E048_CAFRO|nr:hypothetical protein FNF28_01102 [Cafeteria roenbergensis]